MLSSHAKFDANGFGMVIRDLENLQLYIAGSNDIRQDAQQSVTQDNSEPLSTAPTQLTGFDGIGGASNLGQANAQQAVKNTIPYPITAPNGGTGVASPAAHGVLIAEGASPMAVAAPGASGRALVSNGASADPSFQALPVSGLSGTLPIANGGTNSSNALSGSSIMVSNGVSVVQGAAGTSTTVLHGNASGTPSYSAVSLTADVSGTLPVGSGGTGGTTQATAQSGLGLGTMCTQNANAVAITGGTISGGTITDGTLVSLYYRNASRFRASGSFTVPAGVYTIFCAVTAGGGGGGGANAVVAAPTINAGGGGGGGGETLWGFVDVAPGQVLTVTVGAGGSSGAVGGTGGTGGASSITGTSPSVSISANGGGGGTALASGSQGGYGGGRGSGSCPVGMFSSPGQCGNAATISSWTTSGSNLASITFFGGIGGFPGTDPGVNYVGAAQGTGQGGQGGTSGGTGATGQVGGVTIYY